MIWCFGHGSHAPSHGAVVRQTEFGERHFCAKCKGKAEQMPLEEDVLVLTRQPKVLIDSTANRGAEIILNGPKRLPMSKWIRSCHTAGHSLEQIAEALVKMYPDAKPGREPKLAMSYVKSYLGVK